MCVRNIKKVKVSSPTQANREHFAEEIRNKHDLEVIVCNEPEKIYENSDIIAGCTDSAVPVIQANCLEPGQHVVNVGGGGGMPNQEVQNRIDAYFRFGNAPAPQGLPELNLADEYLTYAARPNYSYGFQQKKKAARPGSKTT